MMLADPLAPVLTALRKARPASSDFDLNPEYAPPEGRKLRPAAVLVPILCSGPEPRMLLTKRASSLVHHPGQVAFPGGKSDESDASLEETALREAWEEIALPTASVELLGRLPTHETVTGFVVTPVLGRVRDDFDPKPEAGEVAEIFKVPLSHVTNADNFTVQSRLWRGQRRFYFTVPYGPYYIWGATARILHGLAERMTR